MKYCYCLESCVSHNNVGVIFCQYYIDEVLDARARKYRTKMNKDG